MLSRVGSRKGTDVLAVIFAANAKELSRRSKIAESVPGSADLRARGSIVDGRPGKLAPRCVGLDGIADLGRLERPPGQAVRQTSGDFTIAKQKRIYSS
jgi:hypothetical protein